MAETRTALVEIVLRTGNSSQLRAMFRRELADLQRTVGGVIRGYTSPVDEAVATFARQQFELVQRLAPERPPDFGQAQQATAEERKRILDSLAENIGHWLEALEARLQAELSRMQTAGESEKAITDRLLAEDIADGRVSVWRHGGNTMAASGSQDLWTAATAAAAAYYKAGEGQTGERWRKQVIAAIDERTTDCCLQVHGQIQDLDEPFHLTGTPRYSDYEQHPPFHDFCRTAETLWMERFEAVGITTDEMREAARAELEAREKTKRRVEIHPANAISRR
jgi:hypothetical protein